MMAEDVCCSRIGCTANAKGKSRYCSDSCRAKASHARLYKRIKVVQVWTGPLCHCGRPARFDGFCGNHNNERRAEKARWRKLLKEMQAHFTADEAAERVRLMVADLVVSSSICACTNLS
jgi:hypothetical protein